MDLARRHTIESVMAHGVDERRLTLANDLLLEWLIERGFLRSAGLAAAMRAFRRDRFVAEIDPRIAYRDAAIGLLDGVDGWLRSSCSAPSIVAAMIEALDLAPGMRVLEVGTGTGWSAALMAASVPCTSVTTCEIVPEMTRRAAALLARLHCTNVEVRQGDARALHPDAGSFDRLVLTCGLDRVDGAWRRLLAPGGVAVMPIGSFVFRFVAGGETWTGRALMPADFIACGRGDGASGWRRSPAGGLAVRGAPEAVGLPLLEAAEGTDLDPMSFDQVAAAQCRLELDPDVQPFAFRAESGAWGFGLVGPSDWAALRCPGGAWTRHYAWKVETPALIGSGQDDAAAARLRHAIETAGSLGAIRVRIDDGGSCVLL